MLIPNTCKQIKDSQEAGESGQVCRGSRLQYSWFTCRNYKALLLQPSMKGLIKEQGIKLKFSIAEMSRYLEGIITVSNPSHPIERIRKRVKMFMDDLLILLSSWHRGEANYRLYVFGKKHQIFVSIQECNYS